MNLEFMPRKQIREQHKRLHRKARQLVASIELASKSGVPVNYADICILRHLHRSHDQLVTEVVRRGKHHESPLPDLEPSVMDSTNDITFEDALERLLANLDSHYREYRKLMASREHLTDELPPYGSKLDEFICTATSIQQLKHLWNEVEKLT
jgi:hypothetical protein